MSINWFLSTCQRHKLWKHHQYIKIMNHRETFFKLITDMIIKALVLNHGNFVIILVIIMSFSSVTELKSWHFCQSVNIKVTPTSERHCIIDKKYYIVRKLTGITVQLPVLEILKLLRMSQGVNTLNYTKEMSLNNVRSKPLLIISSQISLLVFVIHRNNAAFLYYPLRLHINLCDEVYRPQCLILHHQPCERDRSVGPRGRKLFTVTDSSTNQPAQLWDRRGTGEALLEMRGMKRARRWR